MSQSRMRPVTGRPVALVDVLNELFDLRLATAAEAREWLRADGWQALDAWISAHRGDPDDTNTTTKARYVGSS